MPNQKLFSRTDFSGSFTDNVYVNDENLCAENDNLLVDNNRKFYVRDGSRINYTGTPQPLSDTSRISRLFQYRDESVRFGTEAGKLFYDTGTTYTSITGPGAVSIPFPSAAALASTNRVSYSEWRGHLLLTNDSGDLPGKVYKDSGGTYHYLTAGLPTPVASYNTTEAAVLTSAISKANSIRTAMIAHFADVTTHAPVAVTEIGATTHSASGGTHRVADTISTALIGAASSGSGAAGITSVCTLVGQLLQAYQNHYADTQLAGKYHWKPITDAQWIDNDFGETFGSLFTPSTADFLPAVASETAPILALADVPTTLMEAVAAINDLIKCYNSHEIHNSVHAGIPNTKNNQAPLSTITGVSYGPLIELDPTAIYTYANLIKTNYTAHIAKVAGGFFHKVADATNVLTAASATTETTLVTLIKDLRLKYWLHNHDADHATDASGAAVTLTWHLAATRASYTNPRPTFSHKPPSMDYFGGVLEGNWADIVAELNVLKNAFNGHVIDTEAHDVSTPGNASTVDNFVPGEDLTLANYVYAFAFSNEYTTSSGETFLDVSPPLLVPATGVIPTTFQGLAISNIPTLTNGSVTHYPTSTIRVKIYRTAHNGTTFYYVGDVALGTTTFLDVQKDADLIATDNTLYITGGVLDNDPPPLAKYVHVVNDKAYWGNVYDTAETHPNRVRESIADDPDSCPADSFVDIQDSEVTGITSCKSIPIVFGRKTISRLEGGFDELGRGSLSAVIVADAVGCISENSIVRTDAGVFFAGTDGFYWTDGYTYKKLSGDWNTSYATWTAQQANQQPRINGAFDSLGRRIWWGMSSTSTSDCDMAVILDLNYPLDPHPTWTTASNSGFFRPTALLFNQGTMYRGDTAGFLFKHNSTYTTDAIQTTLIGASVWQDSPIVYDFTDVCRDFGDNASRKYLTWAILNFRKESNVNSMPMGRNDDLSDWQDLGAIHHINSWVWGDPFLVWGDLVALWNFQRGLLEYKRRFPSCQLRATYKQMRFKNHYKLIRDESSVSAGATNMNATVVNTGGTTRRLTLTTGIWPLGISGHFISLANDNYATEYYIVYDGLGSDTIRVLDPNSTWPANGTAVTAWEINGYPKGEDFSLLGYSVFGTGASQTQQGSRTATSAGGGS